MSQKELEEVFYPQVTADSEVVAAIGTRLYRERFPKHDRVDDLEWPASVYGRVSAIEDETHGGVSGLEMARYQVDSWGRSGKSARTASRALNRAFRKLVGVNSGGIRIDRVTVESGETRYANDRELYGDSQDVIFYYRREIP